VSDVVSLDSAGNEFPYLDQLVPTSGNDDWILWVGGEPHARDPLGVSLIGDGELAVTESVPELDGLVSGTRDNLPVIGGERDREDVTSVSNKSSGGYTSGEFPQSEGLVPRSRESVGTVRGDNTVRDNVSVTVERPLWDTVVLLITGEVPDNQRLVTRTRQKHIWVLEGGSKTGDPSTVTLQSSAQDHVFPHELLLVVFDWVTCEG